MKNILVILLLFIGNILFAQEPQIVLDIKLVNENTKKKLPGVSVEVFKDGSKLSTSTTSSKGAVDLIIVPVGHVYKIKFKKDGFVTKMIEIDGRFDTPEDLEEETYYPIPGSLFESVEGVDFSFLENEPMLKMAFTSDGYEFEWDENHYKIMKKKIADLKKKIEEEKAEAEKAEAERLKREADYQTYVDAGDKAMGNTDYQLAIDQYTLALNLIDKSEIQAKLASAQKLLAESNAIAQKDEEYLAKMKEANSAFSSNELDEALALYNEAKALNPDKTDPQIQINKIIEAKKLQEEKEADFVKLEKQGDVALLGELFEDAINFYEKALLIKNSSVIDDKIINAKKLRDDKINADNIEKIKEEKYQAAVKAADIFYDTEKWEDAKTKYEEAVSIKSEETHPANRIESINLKLAEIKAENEAANALENEYTDLINEANTLKEARIKYSAALEKKSGEKYPINRIELIDSNLAKQAADKVIEEKYLSELNQAKTFFENKKYTEALSKYNLASQIKNDEQEPKDQIIAINKILNDQKNSAQIEAEYSAFMSEGSSLLANDDLTTALDRFKKALNVKDNDEQALTKIKEVEKLISDQQEEQRKQAEFNDVIKQAEISFNAENYEDAKLKYSKALTILPSTEIEAKLKEIDVLISKNQSAEEQKQLFDNALKEADDLFDANKYEDALTKYQAVNSIKKTQHVDDRINTIKKELANVKAAADNNAKFDELVQQASSFQSNKEYQKAIDKYKEAINIKSDQEVNKKIAELGVLILNEQSDAQKEQAYIAMVGKADAEFNNNNWSQAIDYYQKAKVLKDDETYPDDKIAIATSNIQNELGAEVEGKYQANIEKANTFFNNESFDEAIEYYKKALLIKPNEEYPKDQLIAIQKIKSEKVNAESEKTKKENAYNDLVKAADNLLNAENYSGSLDKYEKALLEKPNDSYVINQILKAKDGVAKEDSEKDKKLTYDKLIAEGDALMKSETWSEAKVKFESALAIFNKSYPTNQIITCDEMMKKDSGSEAENAYQKILTVAQKKMDEKNYVKAISLYERALKIRPSDPKPQAKIDEINQILENLNKNKSYDELIQKADNLFEKKEWKKSREFYVSAYAINNDTYADSQIKKIDELDNAYNMKQYDKMISKANEYFIDLNYEKSKGLYERAIKFLPNYDNTFPINRIQEIRDILNPPLAINNGLRELGEKMVGMTEEDMDALLADDSEQRKFNEVNSVKTITKEMKSEKSEWRGAATESTNSTKDLTDEIAVDLQLKGTIAEVERAKAEKSTFEQRKIYDKVQEENAIYTDQARFNQKNVIENVKVEIAENIMNADVPRREYEKEVVGINTNIKVANEFQSAAQTNESFDQKEYVNEIHATHVTQDPNNDVARKKTEVSVVEQQEVYSNERRKESSAQDDATSYVKVNANRMVDEIRLSNIDNDIPRQNTVDKTIDIQNVNESIAAIQSRNQIDVNYDIKTYTDKAVEEIRIESIANDVPRQRMEKTAVKINDNVAEAKSDFAISQKTSTNSTKDEITVQVDIQEKAFSRKNQEREEDSENIIELKEDLDYSSKVIANKNKDVTFETKDYTDKQNDITTQLKEKGNISTVTNQDKTVSTVKELNKNSSEKLEENQLKVDGTVDYITKMKDIDIQKIDVNVKNQLGTDFPEGVTEEIYQVKDSYDLLLSFVVRRIVVTGGEGNVYEKTKSRHGVTTYTKNGDPISKQVWQENTANASLKTN